LRDYIRHDKDELNPWTRQLSTHIGAETLRILVQNWKAFFGSMKAWKALSPEEKKEKSKTEPPHYLRKGGEFGLYIDTEGFRIDKEGGYIVIRYKDLGGLRIRYTRPNTVKQIRIIPRGSHYIVEVVYEDKIPDLIEDNGHYMGIDLGIDNLATITSNKEGFKSFIVNGKGLKSLNQFYNKQLAYYKSILDQVNGVRSSKRLRELSYKGSMRIHDYMHKASRLIVNKAIESDISKIIIGYNKEWKKEVSLGDRTNQAFVSIPYLKLIGMIQYKAQNVGIELIITEESYTSKTSFLDQEYPEKKEVYLGKRIHRGMFRSSKGKCINADLNAAYQIIKKVFPKAYDKVKGIEGLSLIPVRYSLT
jgi:putative transposase